MLKISDAQMSFLGEQQKAAFLERVRDFAAARLKMQLAHTTLQALFARGTEYGLVSECEYAGYFIMRSPLGCRRPRRTPRRRRAYPPVPDDPRSDDAVAEDHCLLACAAQLGRRVMFTAVLSGAQQALLERLSAVATVRTFYLAGGTALALHLGHRRSVDFDFFRPESFDPAELIHSLNPVGTLAVQRAERDTLTVQITGVATSFFAYPHALLQAVVASPWSVSVAAVGDIAAMKRTRARGRSSESRIPPLL